MTDGLDQALANVGLNLLRADLSLKVYDGTVPSPTPAPPYVLVYTVIARPADAASGAHALSSLSSHWTASWYCHCVGGDAVAARAVAQRVRTQLLDVAPVVAGLSCGLIRQADSQPPARDETTGVLVMDALLVFELYASA
jgi:hypothetical protein